MKGIKEMIENHLFNSVVRTWLVELSETDSIAHFPFTSDAPFAINTVRQ